MTVTVPGTSGSSVTLSSGTGDVLHLAAQIGATLESLANLGVTTVDGSGSSTSMGALSNNGTTSVLEILGTTAVSGTVRTGVDTVIDLSSAPVTLTGTNVRMVGGTVGGSYTVFGNSTVAGTGGNNTISATGYYLVSTGDGNDFIDATGAGTVASGNGRNTVVASGHNTIFSQGTNDLVVVTAGNSSIEATGTGFGLLGGSGATVNATVRGDAATVSANDSTMVLLDSGNNGVIFGSNDTVGSLNVTTSGSGNTIVTSAANASIDATGSNSLIVGGTGSLNVSLTGSNDGVITGAGPSTIDASGSRSGDGGVVLNRSGTLDFVGGAGTATIVGDNATQYVTVGSGGIVIAPGVNSTTNIQGYSTSGIATVFGGAGSVVNFAENASGAKAGGIFVAGTGNETLNAAQSNTNNVFAGGSDPSGNVSMIGGSGNNTFFAGASNSTMVGGSGADIFAFFKTSVGGQTDYILNFDQNDIVDILGYDAGQSASSLQNSAIVSNNSVTLTLSDNTKITFANMSSVSQLNGKIFYG